MKSLVFYLRFLLSPPKERMRTIFARSGLHALLTFPDGTSLKFGKKKPDLTFTFHSWKPLTGFFSEYRFAEGYIDSEMDIEGDLRLMSALRDSLPKAPSVLYGLSIWVNLLVKSVTKLNKNAISRHYNFGHDFYLDFLSKKYPAYSQCIYPTGKETLQQSTNIKLENMVRALELKRGMRLLDIGGGWGCVAEYCCPRGIDVTSLTIADDSYDYIQNLIRKKGFKNARVIKQDFLDYQPKQPFDAVVIFGVMEHLPRYRRVMPLLWNILKPDGKIFFDFSAGIFKYAISRFTSDHVWPGNHSPVCLPDLVAELLYNGFEVLRVQNERKDYALTMRDWRHLFVANRTKAVSLAGERAYRVFNLYLSLTTVYFDNYMLQAYHVLARRRESLGARPGFWRRLKSFFASLD